MTFYVEYYEGGIYENQKNLLRIISELMTLCIVFAWMMPMQTQAMSKKRKAMKAYRKYLSQTWLKYYDLDGKEYKVSIDEDWTGDLIPVYAYAPKVKFAAAYINKDKIPELIVYIGDSLNANVSWEHPYGQLYTYKSGKVKCLGGFSLWKPSKSKYYKKKNLIADYAFDDSEDHEIQYFGIRGNKIESKLIKAYLTENSIEYFTWRDVFVNISKKQFNKKLKKLKGNKRSSKFKWHKNTKKNRKKYLK